MGTYAGVHVVGPMQIDVGNVSPTIIDQIEGQGFNLQPKTVVKATGGDYDPTWASFESFAPIFHCTTNKLKTFLGRVGISGAIPTNNGVALYNRAVDLTTGLRKSGANHESYTFASSLIVPRTLSVSHGEQGCKISFDVIGVNSTGLTHPCVLAQSVSLPTIAGVGELFTMGPISIDGVKYEGMQSYNIDFGIQLAVKMGTGTQYPQLVYIQERKPKITIRTNDSSVLSALTVSGLAATTSIVYLRAFSNTGQRVADNVASHISFTITKGLWYPTDKGSSHPSEQMTGAVCEVIYDGSNPIMQINNATTIV